MPGPTAELYLSHKIHYARNITQELVEHHKQEWARKGNRLVSAILFGPLAANPPEYDESINLLEIVEGYTASPRSGNSVTDEFESTSQFPMFGRLKLRVMNPTEFREAVSANHPLIGELRAHHEVLFGKTFAKRFIK